MNALYKYVVGVIRTYSLIVKVILKDSLDSALT